MKKEILQSDAGEWKRLPQAVTLQTVGPFRRVFYQHPVSSENSFLAGTRMLFFSDLHLRPQPAYTVFPSFMRWSGGEVMLQFLQQTIREYSPEHLLFGGDMAAYACMYPEALHFFSCLPVSGMKLGVYGNWDLMRRWLSKRNWETVLQQTGGLRILINERVRLTEGLSVYGMDEFRKGNPDYTPDPKAGKELLLAHNPDSIPLALSRNALHSIGLILCGHTHGGQIRLPGFGAMITSSQHWKRFEYGMYEHRNTGTRLYVSSGMGVTFFRKRIFCPPEILLIEFVRKP